MTIKFYQKQLETIDFNINARYAIDAVGMGCGKSLIALATAFNTNSKLLVICPAYLMLKWKKEVEKFYPDKIVSLLKNDKAIYKLWDTDIAILSYHFIPKADILFEWADIVAFDEAHYLKSMTAQRTQAAHKLIFENSVPRCLFLTGTPIENRVYEFYSMMAMCQYDVKARKSDFLDRFVSYVDFANYFSYPREFEIMVRNRRVKVRQWEGFRNVEELKQYLAPNYTRFVLDDIVELPDSVDIEVQVDYTDSPELEAIFDQFSDKGELDGVQVEVKVKAAMATAPFTADYAKDIIDQGLSVIIFSDHPGPAEAIAKKLKLERHIDGSTPMHIRARMAEEFQSGKLQTIVATIGSFSTGNDLHYADDLICNDLPWKPSLEDQMRGRIRRIGSTKKKRYHYIYGSIQAKKIRNKLNDKREVIKAIV